MASKEERIRNDGRGEWTPITSNVQQIVTMARNRDMVIECVGSSGTTHSFVPALPEDNLWAARCELSSGKSRTWVVDQGRGDTIENCIRRCDPDVKLVEEHLSAFGDGGDA